MNTLKFRCLIDDYLCDIAPFEAYTERGAADVGVVLIAFGSDELDTIRRLFRENVRKGHEHHLNRIQLEGSDGYLYIMSQTSIEKKDKMPHSIMRAYRYYYRYKIKDNKGKKRIEASIRKYPDGLQKLPLLGYRYTDKENEMCFPFRLRVSKEKGKPLFLILHSAGAMGNGNTTPLFDTLPLLKSVLKQDCNILLPQAPFGSNRGDDTLPNYIKAVKKLIDELDIDFDRKRIYIAGASFGGFCVWHLAYLFPGYFAAAVPIMGGLAFDHNFGKYDVTRLVKTPLWVAHSSDDTNVKIDSDDYYVSELKKLGADVKYTRWDEYGHSMYKKFCKTEKWIDWCLSKKLK